MREEISNDGYKVKVKPSQQIKVLLGSYSPEDTIKGFTVETSSDQADVVSTEVIRLDGRDGYKLFMNIANFGNKPVSATIQKIGSL